MVKPLNVILAERVVQRTEDRVNLVVGLAVLRGWLVAARHRGRELADCSFEVVETTP